MKSTRGRSANSLANARTLSFPIDWPEPFGLVMTEDMPVTAWRKELVTEVTVLQG